MPAMNAAASPLLRRKPDDVIDAVGARDVRRAVARPVVDDEHLDDVDAGNATRQIGERRRQRLRFVEARDLDDELHHAVAMLARRADQLLDDAVPGDAARARRSRRRPSPPRARRSAARRLIAVGQRLGLRRADEAVDAVDDELVRAAGIGRGDDRLLREERFERDVAEILVERRIDDRERVAIQLDQALVVDRAEEVDAIGDAGARPRARSAFARCVPSPATTSRIGRST